MHNYAALYFDLLQLIFNSRGRLNYLSLAFCLVYRFRIRLWFSFGDSDSVSGPAVAAAAASGSLWLAEVPSPSPVSSLWEQLRRHHCWMFYMIEIAVSDAFTFVCLYPASRMEERACCCPTFDRLREDLPYHCFVLKITHHIIIMVTSFKFNRVLLWLKSVASKYLLFCNMQHFPLYTFLLSYSTSIAYIREAVQSVQGIWPNRITHLAGSITIALNWFIYEIPQTECTQSWSTQNLYLISCPSPRPTTPSPSLDTHPWQGNLC